jgi:hypothetical protein
MMECDGHPVQIVKLSIIKTGANNSKLNHMWFSLRIQIIHSTEKMSKRYKDYQAPPRSDGLEIVANETFRSAIFADGKLLFKGFPESQEYTDENFTDIDVSSFRAFNCLEGTLIRVFHRSNEWYTATSRRFDAFVSKWASRRVTFGQSFATALRAIVSRNDGVDDKQFLNEFYEANLSKNLLYTFLLTPTAEERIVCIPTEPSRVVYIGSESPETHIINFDDDIMFENSVFPKRCEILGLKTSKDVQEYVFDNIDYNTAQGVILFKQTDDGEMTAIKILSQEYADRFRIRGNVSSLKFRYLELRAAPQKDLDLFFELYPEMVRVGRDIEEMIYFVCKRLHAIYMKIYIENDPSVKCSKDEQSALNIVHKQYSVTRQRTTPSRINDVLAAGNPTRVNRLLREFILREKQGLADN